MNLRKTISAAKALTAGALNGLLGAGGGMLIVPSLSSEGIEPNKAHAGSVAIMLPLSAISAALYISKGTVSLADALPYIPGGIAGAFLGAYLLRKISPKLLKKLFGALAIYAGVRAFLR